MLARELLEIAARRSTRLPEFQEDSILIAPHRRKAALDEQVCSSCGLERPADVVSKIYDVVDTERGNVRKDGVQRRTIPCTSAIAANFM